MSAILDSFDDISKGAPEPIYQQIKKTIQQRIASGEWPAGQKLPSENELVGALEVSRMTINRALRELTQEGLIKRVHGIGSFVAETPRHASLIELQDIALEIAQRWKTAPFLDLAPGNDCRGRADCRPAGIAGRQCGVPSECGALSG